jgi:hypothetical protein
MWAVLVAIVVSMLPLGARAEESAFSIGTSQAGAPLVVYRLGEGAKRVVILGGQHGGPERNTVELVEAIRAYYQDTPLPSGIELDILPVANPDGLANGSRQLAGGVDPNRNWGGSDWRADAFDSNAVFRYGLGGFEPFSEPETRALADWVLQARPSLVINYHSAGGFMFGPRDGLGGELATLYAEASGYRWPQPGPGGGGSPLSYSASGSMNVWLRQSDIPAILVELSTPYYPEVERNLAGVGAVLARLGE